MKRLPAAILPLLLALAPAAGASPVPATGTYLTGLGGGTFGLVSDGTSNTVLIGEQSRLSVCVDNATGSSPLSDIADGTSNTIQFGENLFLTLQVGSSLPYQPIANIQDGTSNTIFIGENFSDERCFAGETSIVDIGNQFVDGTSNTIFIGEESRFDLCFRAVSIGSVSDGTSNTILFGEVSQNPVCFTDVQVISPTATAEVAEPESLALLGLGLAALLCVRRREI